MESPNLLTHDHAISLSGGGAKGAFQVGAMKFMHHAGFLKNVTLSVGTSVGALNSAGLAYHGVKGLEKIWLEIKSARDIRRHAWWKVWNLKGMASMRPMMKLVRDVIDDNKIYTLIQGVACTVSLETGEIRYVSNHQKDKDLSYYEAVIASSIIPFYMEPEIGMWFDGGVKEIAPLKYAVKRARRVTCIVTSPINDLLSDGFKPKWPPIVSIGFRAIDSVMQHEIFLNDLRKCEAYNKKPDRNHRPVDLKIIAPQKPLEAGTLDFKPKQIREMIEAGYAAAEKAFS